MKYNEIITQNKEFQYQLLGRLKQDCDYYLATKDETSLWGKTKKNHIEYMFFVYNHLPIPPEWLTLEEITRYALMMNVSTFTKRKLCGKWFESGVFFTIYRKWDNANDTRLECNVCLDDKEIVKIESSDYIDVVDFLKYSLKTYQNM